MPRLIGLLVNPVAGMGGSVGLKGTDGELHAQALALGAEPVSPARTRAFLDRVLSRVDREDGLRLLVAPGPMGEDYVDGFDYELIGAMHTPSTSADTQAVARAMLAAGAEVIVFAGGDGTARDIVDSVAQSVPVIAIPAGVKVYSSVFAYSPAAAADLLDAYLNAASLGEEEVLDIDEAAYREGRVEAQHYGFLLVPEADALLQAGKESSATGASSDLAKQDMAQAIVEDMQEDVLYLLGCGTTIRYIGDVLGIEKTLLGIDAVHAGKLLRADCNENDILELLKLYARVRIIVTPLGGNGFLFGRGNKQLSPAVLRAVGKDQVIVIANRDKLLRIKALHVDTGDEEVDALFRGYIKVIVGRGHHKLMPVL